MPDCLTPQSCILALDIGSSSLRGLLFDERGQPCASAVAQRTYRFALGPDGAATLDPEQIVAAAVSVVDELAAHQHAPIRAVAIASLAANAVAVDRHGQPLTPLYTYADTRSTAEAAALRTEIDEPEIHQATGCRIHSSFWPALHRWLRRHEPQSCSAVVRWMGVGELLHERWLGRSAMSLSAASWTGLLNRHTLDWHADLLRRIPLDAATLPALNREGRPLHGLRPEWAARWPTLRDAAWFPAIADGAAANVGSGCVDPSRVALTIGTSAAIRVLAPGVPPVVPENSWNYRLDSRRSLTGGALNEGGNIFAWLQEILRLPPGPDLEAELSRCEPASSGLNFLPLLAGERAPGWRSEARGAITGLRLGTTAVSLVHAAMEGVALRLAMVYRDLVPLLPQDHELTGSGAALLSSPAWAQIVADCLGRRLVYSEERQATARGAAVLALEWMGLRPAPAATGRIFEPRPEIHARYLAALERQQSLDRHLYGTA